MNGKCTLCPRKNLLENQYYSDNKVTRLQRKRKQIKAKQSFKNIYIKFYKEREIRWPLITLYQGSSLENT